MLKKIGRVLFRKIIMYQYQKKLIRKDFTIISQNCLAGVLYHDMGINFLSPTINMFIEDDNFIKLVDNLEYYLSLEAKPYIEKYQEPMNPQIIYPKIKVGDVELCCMHYTSCKDAVEAWERRRKRVNLQHVFVIGNTWNMHNKRDLIERLCKMDRYKVICFTNSDDFTYENCVRLQGDFWKEDERGMVRPNMTDYIHGSFHRYYEKQFDFIRWFNESC